jgi:type I restriction-modification system DNA methylase subunit
MPPVRRKKAEFKAWLSYLESVCRRLYEQNEKAGPAEIYSGGVRLTLAILFQRIAELRGQPPEPFIDCFTKPEPDIPLKPISFPFAEMPDGFLLDLFDDPEFPGWFYGECLRYTMSINQNGTLKLAEDRSRRLNGTFYTPDVITRFLAKETIEPLIHEHEKQKTFSIRICDPAMGTGNFLSAAGKYLSNVYASLLSAFETSPSKGEIFRLTVTKSLYGMDIDPVSVLIARAYFAVLCGIKPQDMKNFIVADSLLDPLPFKDKFDVVIGNPPWVSYGMRNVEGISKNLLKTYRERFPCTAEYKISIYALFAERALSLTRDGGYHGFIVPDSWLTGKFFEKLRTHLLENSTFHRLILILHDFWEKLSIGRSVIYIVKKDDNSRPEFETAIIQSPKFLKEVDRKSLFISTSRIKTRNRKRIVLYPDEKTKQIVERMEDSGDLLGNHIRFYSGLIGKNGRNSIVIIGKPGDYTPKKYGKLIESGKFLQKDNITFNECYVKLDKSVYKSGFDFNKYINPKIFLNQTGFRLKACYDKEGYFCLNNLHIGYPLHKDADLRFYTFLLNSRLMNFYYSTMSMEENRALAQTDIDFLHGLPVGTNPDIFSKIKKALKKPKKIKQNPDELLAEWYGLDYETLKAVYRKDD